MRRWATGGRLNGVDGGGTVGVSLGPNQSRIILTSLFARPSGVAVDPTTGAPAVTHQHESHVALILRIDCPTTSKITHRTRHPHTRIHPHPPAPGRQGHKAQAVLQAEGWWPYHPVGGPTHANMCPIKTTTTHATSREPKAESICAPSRRRYALSAGTCGSCRDM